MAELRTLARPYARAAFESARKADLLGEWSESLGALAAVSLEPKILGVLKSPALSGSNQVEILVTIFGKSIPDGVARFLNILSLNRRLPLLPIIHSLFEEYKANLQKVVDVELFTAFEVNEELHEKLSENLARHLEREVNVRQNLDPGLIGGVLIKAGDTVIDGSIRGRLAMLSEAIEQ